MRCRLCEREAAVDLCHYHSEAKRRVEEAFQHWKAAYGTLEWNEYLERIIQNPETGQWAAEVAKWMRDSPEGGPATISSP